ncbi:hypothetical protein M422DRAFT_272449 [Sphaerobolus stellatus SS14]|uniref:Uncharacterized protein n=1 Tax=Sphaerobolus stellatus (strain SS14) TaxID=990650 RepID=A0A0C9UM01_SPHS4|nr:hypothetical protein M422DRAFT_272449 [Sphaerobolus stellatus SS14]
MILRTAIMRRLLPSRFRSPSIVALSHDIMASTNGRVLRVLPRIRPEPTSTPVASTFSDILSPSPTTSTRIENLPLISAANTDASTDIGVFTLTDIEFISRPASKVCNT